MFEGTSGHSHQFWPPRSGPFNTVLSPLEKLRNLITKNGIGYYIVLTQDAHNSEYVALADKRREFISGFTGSSGTAIIGLDFAELATDGRYYLQAEQQLGPEWTLRKEGLERPWIDALAERANSQGKDIGVDPALISYSTAQRLMAKLNGPKLVAIDHNLIDSVWLNKPQEPKGAIFSLDVTLTGESYHSKLERVRKELYKNDTSAICIAALDDIAWLFNLRGSDIPFSPVFKAYALVTLSSVKLYVDLDKIKGIRDAYSDVEFKQYSEIVLDVQSLGEKSIWIPEGGSWALVKAAVNCTVSDMSPPARFKSVKTAQEIQGARHAQFKSGLAFVQLFAWLDRNIDTKRITEYDAAEKLLSLFNSLDDFMGLSYESISSVGPNAAIIHYEPPPDSKFVISRDEPYLLDAGCQFLHGTTDTTRTVCFGSPEREVIRAYTLVLKGHIGLSTVVFPEGTVGSTLDILARQHLWQYGLNYRHGTGHGVGSFLNVHELPVGVGVSAGLQGYGAFPFAEGQITSNEPGCYIDNKFGVRIESMQVVQKADTLYQYDNTQYYKFEYITLAPLALNLIDTSLLSVEEIKWVNNYSAAVYQALGPHLSGEDKAWLKKNTHPI